MYSMPGIRLSTSSTECCLIFIKFLLQRYYCHLHISVEKMNPDQVTEHLALGFDYTTSEGYRIFFQLRRMACPKIFQKGNQNHVQGTTAKL